MADAARLVAVIFDVDGVLVRSMQSHAEAYRQVFDGIGVVIDPADVYENEGRSSREVIAQLGEARKLGLSDAQLEALNAEKQRIFAAFGPRPVYPGVDDMLRALKRRGLRLAAVTGTTRRNVNNHLNHVLDQLDVIVTADDVRRTKPDPEPYLQALAKLGIRADQALVVENAPLGIKAAKAAGIRVAGVTSTLPAERLHEADIIIPSVTDVLAVVEEALS